MRRFLAHASSHREGGDRLRRQPRPHAAVAASNVFIVFVQEGHQFTPTPSDLRRDH
jgi:hypothetical protein